MWLSLLASFAAVGFFVSVWANLQDWALSQRTLVASSIFGILMGLASISALALSIDVAAGVKFDLRGTAIAVAAILGGPVAALVAAVMAGTARLVVGGAGAIAGLVSIGLTVLAGLASYYMSRGRLPNLPQILLSSFLAGLAPLVAVVTIEGEAVRNTVWATGGLPIFVLTMLSTFSAVWLVVINSRRAAERALLLGAIKHAPDYFYVKNPKSQIMAANRNVAHLIGADGVEDVKGKTDFEMSSPERAQILLEEEQHIVETGEPLLNKHEMIEIAEGEARHFVSSKTPVQLGNGQVVGIVGVSRDITAEHEIRTELSESRDRLSFILQEMSDGVALIRHDGTIVLSNQRYRDMFPRTGSARVPGAYLPTILQAVIDTGEQPAVTAADAKAWMSDVMHAMRTGGDQLVQLFDGRWLHMRTQVHAEGMSIAVVSDITAIKRAETNLRAMTKQLEHLALTDGLTSLVNRRGFDDAIDREVGRARRSDTPISVLLIDVDRFKAYNDRYGHLEGDSCLQAVAEALRSAVKRPVDVVARYGGEEFAILLPDTGNTGAYHVAEEIRSAVRNRAIEHEASEKGIVTVSIGTATMEGIDPDLTPRLLMLRADEALYLAKGGGRDKTAVWTDPKQTFANVAYL
ncbi:diguanylate cyclase [Devosia sp.]|uniref:diguanylate cyclase n=1 Tax=Devosia sp. TaxID=1871048 RepID=UPI003A9598DA